MTAAKKPGGTDLERGYGDVRPSRPPFHASPAARKGPISRSESVHKTPFWENLEILPSTALIFAQILSLKPPNLKISAHKPPNLETFSSQAPKFGNFQLTSPQIWKFSVHKPPFSEANIRSQAPHFRNPGRTPLPKKSWVPPQAKKQCFLRFLYWTESSPPPPFKVRGLQMTINLLLG